MCIRDSVSQVTPESPDIPRAMVLTGSFALSLATGLFCHHRPREWLPANLTPASGRQDHTTSPSARKAPSSLAPLASTASCPASVTISSRPSVGQDGEGYKGDLRFRKIRIFLQMGLDRQISDLPVGYVDRPVRRPSKSVGRIGAQRVRATARPHDRLRRNPPVSGLGGGLRRYPIYGVNP